MKVGLISDIHSNFIALEEVLRELDSREVSKILCVGDLVGYGASPNLVVDKIRRRNILCVKGNHDQGVVDNSFNFNPSARKALEWTRERLRDKNKVFLRNIPERRDLNLGKNRTLIIHGSPANPMEEYTFPGDLSKKWAERNKVAKFDLVIMGHTHIPFSTTLNNTLFVNPGSVGQPRNREPGAHFSIFETSKKELKHIKVDYNIKKASEKIKNVNLPENLAKRLFEGV